MTVAQDADFEDPPFRQIPKWVDSRPSSMGEVPGILAATRIRLELVVVTPELATTWLDAKEPNRTLKKRRIVEWTRDMEAGRWRPIPSPIWIDTHGRLIDGEHRLTAVVESGATVGMWVAFGVPEQWRSLVDSNTPRSAADVLLMEHGMHSARDAQAISRYVLLFDRFPDRVWNFSGEAGVGKLDLLEEVQSDLLNYGRAVKTAGQAQRAAGANRYCTRAAYGALCLLVHRDSEHQDLWAEWHEGIVTGANLAAGDPRLTLRNATAGPRWGAGQSNLMAVLRAWEAWVNGEELKLIKTSKRYLPMKAVA